MIRSLLLLLALTFLSGPAVAQTPATPPASTDDLKSLSKTLSSDADRAAFLKQLNALIAARDAQTNGTAASKMPIAQLQQAMDAIGTEAIKSLSVVQDLPNALGRITNSVEDPAIRTDWEIISLKVLSVLAIAILAESITARLLRRSKWRPFGAETRRGVFGGVLVLLRLAISAIPILVFAGIALALMSTVPENSLARPIASAWVEANVIERFILVFSTVLFLARPPVPAPFALPAGDDTRIVGRIQWLARIGCYGWATAETLLRIGVPSETFALALRLVALIFTVTAIVFVLRSRRAIAGVIAGPEPDEQPEAGAEKRLGSLRRLRRGIADTWHIAAIVYLVASFAVLMIRSRGGFLYVLEQTAISIAILGGARLILNAFAHYASDRQTRFAAEGLEPGPTQLRTRRYLHWIGIVLRAVVWAAALLLILASWGADVGQWFKNGLGQILVATLMRIGLVIVVAVFLWELTSTAIERTLDRRDREGLMRGRPSRARTLLPLLRNALFITLIVLVALVIMGQLGLNTGPLVAGASVVGVAVGLGAQQLVKDVITGLFMLIENTVAIGDSINLGSTQMGVPQIGIVENISLRTIQLRDDDGALHTVPFSQVNAVINFSRDYAFYQLSLTLPADQDVEAVAKVLRDASDALAQDQTIGSAFAAPIEIRGVDSIGATNYTMKARLKTLPLRQWDVGRAFNRLLQERLAHAGIKLA